jgi:anaerobic magnesium-protoporphyrin IX monomethyl ester cyclase
MKSIIGYPPLTSKKGIPLLSQNRQFQWFKIPTYIYPVIPASAASMLKKAGHQVFWLDGIAKGWSYQQWLKEVKKINPDLLVMETKTPVIKLHWKIINDLKITRLANSGQENLKLKIVLVGDHVTALPQESLVNSKVDYVLTGGDYDFLLLNLVNHLTKEEKLESGIYYRNKTTRKPFNNNTSFALNETSCHCDPDSVGRSNLFK